MRSAQSCSLAQAVFRPLGQIAPVELGSKRQLTQTLLDEFSGYPLYTTAPEFGIPSSLNYPLFVLGGNGCAAVILAGRSRTPVGLCTPRPTVRVEQPNQSLPQLPPQLCL